MRSCTLYFIVNGWRWVYRSCSQRKLEIKGRFKFMEKFVPKSDWLEYGEKHPYGKNECFGGQIRLENPAEFVIRSCAFALAQAVFANAVFYFISFIHCEKILFAVRSLYFPIARLEEGGRVLSRVETRDPSPTHLKKRKKFQPGGQQRKRKVMVLRVNYLI